MNNEIPEIENNKKQSALSRYIEVVVSLAIFACLTVGLITFNFKKSQEIDEQTHLIDLTARQVTITEHVQESLLQMKLAAAEGKALPERQEAISEAHDLFENTLKAFEMGGFVKDEDGITRSIAQVQSESGRKLVAEARALWDPFRKLLRPIVLIGENPTAAAIEAASSYSSQYHEDIGDAMVRLSLEFEDDTQSGQSTLRWAQVIVFFLGLLNFAYLAYVFVTKIRRSDSIVEEKTRQLEESFSKANVALGQLETAKSEADAILKTVREGLLLIDRNYQIAAQYSEDLKNIFRVEDPAGMSLLKIFQKLLTEKDYITSRDYLEMLFDPSKKEKTLGRINPLEEAEMHFQEKDASFSTRYFEFQFKRLYKDEAIEQIFVSIRDITTQVELTKRLKDSEEKKERQFSLLLDMVNLSASDVEEFCRKSSEAIEQINAQLKAEDFVPTSGDKSQNSGDLRDRVNAVYRHVHAVKGNASALGIHYFVKQAHGFEDALARIRNRPKLSGEDFLGIISHLSELKNSVAECQELASKLGGANLKNTSAPAAAGTPNKASAERSTVAQICQRLAQDLASTTGRKARLVFKGEDVLAEAGPIRSVMDDIMPQLIRNSFAHGIESPLERVQAGKPEEATINIHVARSADNRIRLEYQDDGRGLEGEKIKTRSIALGLVDPGEAGSLPEKSFWPFIFEPGFSTSEQIDEISGRGAGLDLVRDVVMVRNQGQIFLDSKPGESVHFTFEIPA